MKFFKKTREKLAKKLGRKKGTFQPPVNATQEAPMSEEDRIDESLMESFPASDPPAHFSKGPEDRDLHRL